jgi:Fuc2NAc and GlcNAc transferase
MRLAALGIAVLVFLVSFLVSMWVRQFARSRGMLDIPNERSSHDVPTPRGGGLGIVVAMTLGTSIAWLAGLVDEDLAIALTGGGLLIAAIGLADDRRPMPSSVRLIVHGIAAAWAIFWLRGLPPLQFGVNIHDLGSFGYVLGIVGLVWAVNLFNFMDGIDGIAASEASFMSWAALVILGQGSDLLTSATLMLALGAASAGFLVWNWPPARIFMGDVGSGYLGFAIGVLAIASSRSQPVALPVWAVLGAIFIADTAVTLVTRVSRGERVYQAHRSHAYQVLARRWVSHRRTTIAVCVFNLLFLLPMAWIVWEYPAAAGWVTAAAILVPGVIALTLGAGRNVS